MYVVKFRDIQWVQINSKVKQHSSFPENILHQSSISVKVNTSRNISFSTKNEPVPELAGSMFMQLQTILTII